MKKAYLVDFTICRRVVVDSDATEEQVIQKALEEINGEPLDMSSCISICEDLECPVDEYDV